MRIAISNIAWRPDNDPAVAPMLAELGVEAIEVAPTVLWPRPLDVTQATVEAYREKWESAGIRIVALQSLLYGRPDLVVFGTTEKRKETLSYLVEMFRVAAWLGARELVFGSPRNRSAAGMSATERDRLAAEFFRAAGEAAVREGVVLCFEPNPREYDCDFVRTVAEARTLVAAVGSPGFGLNLDSAAMTLAGDSPAAVTAGIPPRHFHVSEPYLAPVGEKSKVDHAAFAAELRRGGFEGSCSIEMKATTEPDSLSHVRRAVEFARGVYGDASEKSS